ncbi:hypothetical protein [Streptosporangium sp. NPDC006007]|uniref:hypothetical protein n=1 Tax=Streptosporangium sp. NPDC006007 TaxID=3154575 RepID=UPI0033B3CF27
MRRMIAALTGATVAALVTPALLTAAPAAAQSARSAPQSAQADPVSALKRQFRVHRGVRLAENTKLIGEGRKQRMIFTRRNGVLEFDRKGVAASDLTSTFNLPGGDSELKGVFVPFRTVTVKGVSYTSGGMFGDSMPEGKKWLRDSDDMVALGSPAQQLLNPLEPATLKAALAHTTARRPGGTWDGTRTVVHSGTITLGELYKVSPAFRSALGVKLSAKSAKVPVTWQLYIGSDQLVRRAVSSYTQSLRGLTSVDLTYLNDSRYTGWGTRSSIKAPPADQVADFDDLKVGEGAGEDPYIQLFTG